MARGWRVGGAIALCALFAACTPLPAVTSAAGSGGSGGTPQPTPTASSAPAATADKAPAAPVYPGAMLQVGMTSTAVKQVQQKLGVSPVTGYYGPLTEAAVKTFQKAHGLEVDGQVGPLTWSRIFGTPVPASPVSTTTPTGTSTPKPTAPPKPPAYPAIIRPSVIGANAVALAAKEAGKPYLWGGSGPNSFDCSGLTMYVYKQLGVSLMRSANDQFKTTLHVPYAKARPGDLIFFYDTTGYVYHVGIYAGNGMMWDAPHTGAVVRYENVWYPDSVWVGVPGAKLAG